MINVVETHDEDAAPPSLTALANINGLGVAMLTKMKVFFFPFLDVVTHRHSLCHRSAFAEQQGIGHQQVDEWWFMVNSLAWCKPCSMALRQRRLSFSLLKLYPSPLSLSLLVSLSSLPSIFASNCPSELSFVSDKKWDAGHSLQ